MEFFQKNGVENVDPRVTAWCAAYVDAVLGASGNEQRKSLRAADFLTYGAEAKTPGAGNVVVFKPLAEGSSGHVGIVTGINGDRVNYIAGNDANAVSESSLPLSKVAGFRLPKALGGGENNDFGGLPTPAGFAQAQTPVSMPELTPPKSQEPDTPATDLSGAIASFAKAFPAPATAKTPAPKPQMPALLPQTPRIPVADRVAEAPKKANLGAILAL